MTLAACGLVLACGAMSTRAGSKPGSTPPAPSKSIRLLAPHDIDVSSLDVLEEARADASLDQVLAQPALFHPVSVRTPNYHFSSSAYWFHMPIRNRRNQGVILYLSVKHSTLDDLTLHVLGQGGRRQLARTGDRIPANERPYPSSTLVLPFRLDAGESADLYLRVRAEAAALLIPIELLDEKALGAEMLRQRLIHGAMLGLFLSLFIYNVLVFALLRESTYLYYVIYLFFSYFASASLDGFGSVVFFPGSTWFGNEGLLFFSGAAFVFILQFMRSFLRTWEHPRLDRLVKGLMSLGLFLVASPWLLPIRIAYQLDMFMVFVFPWLCLVVGVDTWRAGKTEARFFVLGQVASWIGMLLFGLMMAGALPYRDLLFEGISIGVAADALLLALALADRIRILQKAKRHAEDEVRRNLESRGEELERMVVRRTTELEAARKHAEILATTDPLTGVLNRRGLLERAERDLQIAMRYGRPLSVIIFDIDHFKQVNDNFGHSEGDRVLRQVVSSVRGTLRATDLFGRIGGEEFLLVMPDTGGESAMQVAERIRNAVANEVTVGTPPRPVTASFGVAWVSEKRNDLDRLQSTADDALYRAKHKGRNRVEVAEIVALDECHAAVVL